MKWLCGVDIGGTTVKLGLFTTEGELKEKWEIPTRKEEGGSHILPDVAASIKEHLKALSADKADLCGVGMGVPGPVDQEGFIPRCVNLGWGRMQPAKELSALLDGVYAACGNDANVAALGEAFKGAAAGEKNVVMLTLGTGVGGGVIVNGVMVDGAHGAGGELGHMVVDPSETLPCNCGNKGCLEQYASATGVVRVAKRLLAKGQQTSKLSTLENFSAKDVFDCAKAGDVLAGEAVETLCRYLGYASANCALVTDPDIFVIGGGVSRAGEILTTKIAGYFEEFSHIIPKKARFVLAELGNDAGIYGAARLASQQKN